MAYQDNGQPPAGYQAPIFNAMNDDQLVAFVPRPIICMIVLLCVGVGVLSRSWGAILLYVLLHGIAAYLTYRDARWLPVLVESLRMRFRFYRLGYHDVAWTRHVRLMIMLGGVGVVLIYTLSLWVR